MHTKSDIYTEVTNKIIADLEQGTHTWLQPWQSEHREGSVSRPLRSCGTAYQGINVILLWASAIKQGFSNPIWLTYKQATTLGAYVRKAEKASMVVYANSVSKTETDSAGNEIESTVPFMKTYNVFNAQQIDGLPEHFYTRAKPIHNQFERMEPIEQFFAATGVSIHHGYHYAAYSPVQDIVRMPDPTSFHDTESYYATLAHEMTHWTSHASRLDRNLGGKRFADAGYAMEELVAEIGSAFLCADLGITPETREDHANYIASWLTVLRKDKRAVFTAAAHAQRAIDFLHHYQKE